MLKLLVMVGQEKSSLAKLGKITRRWCEIVDIAKVARQVRRN
jgi:hypothetical protein